MRNQIIFHVCMFLFAIPTFLVWMLISWGLTGEDTARILFYTWCIGVPLVYMTSWVSMGFMLYHNGEKEQEKETIIEVVEDGEIVR